MEYIRADAAHQRRIVNLLHGTNVFIDLVNPWRNTWRTVYIDSYSASVPAVGELKRSGLYFFGVVKMATKKYPIHF